VRDISFSGLASAAAEHMRQLDSVPALRGGCDRHGAVLGAVPMLISGHQYCHATPAGPIANSSNERRNWTLVHIPAIFGPHGKRVRVGRRDPGPPSRSVAREVKQAVERASPSANYLRVETLLPLTGFSFAIKDLRDRIREIAPTASGRIPRSRLSVTRSPIRGA